ncbi:hypothetical protein R69927_00460 [Paraburkholderia domus]|jgi:hypothetical protein|uniref:Peptide-binding protein n=1 Tax=Paraburkholderia domus TaxID=2793075 RepID=A0A9N8MJM7_9BURK|nr:hypothetical protein [Burkholderia sp. R-70006]MBK5084585.1 hypothetical protein [Burkholderia sp. R-69927]MBK5125760.1 hypothetical protein [Burkholderia sp. R-69980]MBK5163626.1 hypothetical protein [Burkholderia sp. R-70211]MBK5180345.1 hypothetical protein [Burkholderia sp. R-69749]MCI0148069.1 hypothetical protein [Paraburkholderia sediminicola]CAE6692894.1 hypothetical protein R70006_00440 [Paraburkholderia domus]
MPRAATDTQRSCRSQNKSIAARTVGFRQVFGHVSHLVDGLSRTKHWALGAVITVLCSFAYAKVPNMPHGGGDGYSHSAVSHAMRGDAHNGGHYYGAANVRPARNNVADSHARLPHGGPNFAAGNYVNGFGGYNPGMHRVAGPGAYPGDARGGMQYAGAITPVSTESRSVPRPPPNAPVRSGSIRADVARYNEERGSSRAMQRQSDDPRQQEGLPYRN